MTPAGKYPFIIFLDSRNLSESTRSTTNRGALGFSCAPWWRISSPLFGSQAMARMSGLNSVFVTSCSNTVRPLDFKAFSMSRRRIGCGATQCDARIHQCPATFHRPLRWLGPWSKRFEQPSKSLF